MININQTEKTIDVERLLFRRQFVLDSREFTPNQYWSCIYLHHGLCLSIHTDLPCSTTSNADVTLTLVGHAIDPYQPEATESDILQKLLDNASDVDSLISSTMPLSGRWVIIYQFQQCTHVFTDPCGFRQVFYFSDGEQVLCASQPELIKAIHPLRLNTDYALMPFLMHPVHARKESQWAGTSTLYENCFHLLPNHYLDLDRVSQVRFYPCGRIPIKETSEIVQSVSSILQGTMMGLTCRHEISLALTSGWDSRVLLAASRHVRDHIQYFVYRQNSFNEGHPDIWVPERIAKKLGIKFIVKFPSDRLPGWFVYMLSQNVTCARVLPKTHNIYDKLLTGDTRMNINGNASEICRNFFDKYCKIDMHNLSTTELAALMFGQKAIPSFVIQELDEWRNGLQCFSTEGLNILDLLYWEQRLGNWGAQYPSEQDIAIEEISPFNCRLLIHLLLASPRNMRAAPDYPLYHALIKKMWPETLAFPINPRPKGRITHVMKNRIRTYVPSSAVRIINKWMAAKTIEKQEPVEEQDQVEK